MSRTARKYIESEYWHIMLRGIGHIDLFLADEDYARFEKTVCKYKAELNVPLYAYCLMSNHVHMLVKSDTDKLRRLFSKIEISYSYYYNQKYEHAGHLFQNRYKSEPIRDEKYLLSAFRYVLRNPEAAGISSWENYSWSSAPRYLGDHQPGITDIDFLSGILGGAEKIREFVSATTDVSLAEPENVNFALKDEKASAIIMELTGADSPIALQAMQKDARNAALASLKKAGLSIRQLERLTGINRNVIQRAK